MVTTSLLYQLQVRMIKRTWRNGPKASRTILTTLTMVSGSPMSPQATKTWWTTWTTIRSKSIISTSSTLVMTHRRKIFSLWRCKCLTWQSDSTWLKRLNADSQSCLATWFSRTALRWATVLTLASWMTSRRVAGKLTFNLWLRKLMKIKLTKERLKMMKMRTWNRSRRRSWKPKHAFNAFKRSTTISL